MSGKICPNCNNDIGVLSVVFASIPTSIECPHCGTKLRYQNTPWVLTIVCLLIYSLFLFGLFSEASLLGIASSVLENPYIFVPLVFFLWAPFDIGLSYFVRKKRRLVLK